MVGLTASFAPGSPPLHHPIGTLCASAGALAAKPDWLARVRRARKTKAPGGRDGEAERGKNGQEGSERRRKRDTRCIHAAEEERVRKRERGRATAVDVPHFYHQCLTSVAPAWLPPRNESITLNNVNVSPSQHKTNNHRSLPRAMSARPPQNPGDRSSFFVPLSRAHHRAPSPSSWPH